MAESPFSRWCHLCEDAMCSPDTLMTAAEFAARYEKHTGNSISVAAVRRIRKAGWDWVHAQPTVGGFTLRWSPPDDRSSVQGS